MQCYAGVLLCPCSLAWVLAQRLVWAFCTPPGVEVSLLCSFVIFISCSRRTETPTLKLLKFFFFFNSVLRTLGIDAEFYPGTCTKYLSSLSAPLPASLLVCARDRETAGSPNVTLHTAAVLQQANHTADPYYAGAGGFARIIGLGGVRMKRE